LEDIPIAIPIIPSPTSPKPKIITKDDTTIVGRGSSITPKGKSPPLKNSSVPQDTKWYQEMMMKLKQT